MQAIIAILVIPITAVVQFIKQIFKTTGNTNVVIAFIVGGIVGIVYHYTQYPEIQLFLMILYGLIAGGITAGLWSSASSLLHKINKK